MSLKNSLQLMLKELRVPLVMWSVAIAGSSGLAYYSLLQYQKLAAAHTAANSELQGLSSTVRSLREDLGNAQKFLTSFESLSDQAVVGAFQKQRALDQFEAVVRAGGVEPKSYALAAQAPVEGPEFSGLTQHQIVKHALTFEVVAPHELRLVAMVDGLQTRHLAGLNTVEACEISASRPEKKDDAVALPTLSARCFLTWYRFDAKSDPNPAASPSGPLGGSVSAALQPLKAGAR
jgi:hypothetical protein